MAKPKKKKKKDGRYSDRSIRALLGLKDGAPTPKPKKGKSADDLGPGLPSDNILRNKYKRHAAKMKKAGPGWLLEEDTKRSQRTSSTRKALSPLAEGMESYGGKGWEKAKKNPGKVVRHPESRRGSKD